MVSKILGIFNIKTVEEVVHPSVPSLCYTVIKSSWDTSHVNLEQQANKDYLDQNGNLYTVMQFMHKINLNVDPVPERW
jgi:hypothetical protein